MTVPPAPDSSTEPAATAPLEIFAIPLGPLDTNCYLVFRRGGAEAVVFDPGGDPAAVLDLIRQHHLTVAAIVLTHGHGDHLGGVEPLFAALKYTPPYYAPALEKEFLRRGLVNLSAWLGFSVTTRPADHWISGGEQLTLAGIAWTVRHTPGHTPGHMIWICKGGARQPMQVISGDLIFRESVGRTDFPGGSSVQLVRSIETEIWPLPDDTVLHPGHGPVTTVGYEKKHNPFVPNKGG